MRSFSNTNRVLASIIYIGYTNDIIKMFIYYFTVDLSGKQIPLIGIQSGWDKKEYVVICAARPFLNAVYEEVRGS